MAKKKKEPMTGISSDPENKLTVQKANPLSALWRSDLTLAEFKIMDAYLSRIDSHKPDKRAVRFEKGEIEKLLGVKKINVPELKERVRHLMTPLIIEDGPKSFRGICLFEEAYCEADKNGVWQVDLQCTQKAMKYFFNIDTIGYYRYKLRCITGLKSRYTYLMFNYLERNRFRKSWVEDLEELKRLLNCDNEETYKEFKFFNLKILKPIHKELHEKTECRYNYETLKKGRTVTAIRFTVETLSLPNQDTIPGQITLDEIMHQPESDRQIPEHLQLIDTASGSIFTVEELEALWQAVAALPDTDLPDVPYGGIEIQRYHYVAEKVALMKMYDAKKPIKNKIKYLLTMIHEKEE